MRSPSAGCSWAARADGIQAESGVCDPRLRTAHTSLGCQDNGRQARAATPHFLRAQLSNRDRCRTTSCRTPRNAPVPKQISQVFPLILIPNLQAVYLWAKHKQMFQRLLGVRFGRERRVFLLKGVIMAALRGNNGGLGRRAPVTSGEGEQGPWTEANGGKTTPSSCPCCPRISF